MDRDDWLIIRKAGETATGAQVFQFLTCTVCRVSHEILRQCVYFCNAGVMKNLHLRGLFVRKVGSFGKVIAGSVCTSELQQAQQSQISKKLWVI